MGGERVQMCGTTVRGPHLLRRELIDWLVLHPIYDKTLAARVEIRGMEA